MTLTEYIAELRRRAAEAEEGARFDAGVGASDTARSLRGQAHGLREAATLAESVTPGWRDVTPTDPPIGERVVALVFGAPTIVRRDECGRWWADSYCLTPPLRYLPIPADEAPHA